ncbi:MAG: efflux RND transporter periplasmic adaptor subunit [Gammaproteobacteria bacterium]
MMSVMKTNSKIGFWLVTVLLISACGNSEQQPEKQKTAGPGIPIAVTTAVSRDLESWEFSVGQLEPKVAPMIAAEVAGRLIAVNADVGARIQKGQVLAEIDAGDFKLARDMTEADIDRLQALIKAQQLKVKRYRALVKKKSVNQSMLDDAEAQLGALQAELVAAQVRRQQALRDIRKTRITSPINGRVDDSQVSKGDYVKVGSPLMRIGNLHWLKARLPYPETLLSKLHKGLPVRLSSPSVPEVMLETTVSEVRPSITFGSRSAQVIINLENPGSWQPGATVTGAVRVALHKGAIVVPEACVVRRPAGTVVYVIDDGKAAQRVVQTGLRRDGQVEILSGLKAGERVAVDGSGFLTNGVAVVVKGS